MKALHHSGSEHFLTSNSFWADMSARLRRTQSGAWRQSVRFADQAVRLWLLCPSFQRGAQEEVPGGHALLDGARGHLETTVRDRGEDDTHTDITLQQ